MEHVPELTQLKPQSASPSIINTQWMRPGLGYNEAAISD